VSGCRHRKILVHPRYQFVQLALVLVTNIVVTVTISALLSWFYLLAWDGAVAYNHNQHIPLYVALFALAVTSLTVFFSLRQSRAIAGMMHKIYETLDDADRGVFPDGRLEFRANDYFRQMADPLNRCLDRLRRGRADAILRARLDNLVGEIDSGAVEPAAIRQALHAILRESADRGTPPGAD